MYPEGSMVRYQRVRNPYVGRVLKDDPARQRALLRLTADRGDMQPHSLITAWVPYSRIQGSVQV